MAISRYPPVVSKERWMSIRCAFDFTVNNSDQLVLQFKEGLPSISLAIDNTDYLNDNLPQDNQYYLLQTILMGVLLR